MGRCFCVLTVNQSSLPKAGFPFGIFFILCCPISEYAHPFVISSTIIVLLNSLGRLPSSTFLSIDFLSSSQISIAHLDYKILHIGVGYFVRQFDFFCPSPHSHLKCTARPGTINPFSLTSLRWQSSQLITLTSDHWVKCAINELSYVRCIRWVSRIHRSCVLTSAFLDIRRKSIYRIPYPNCQRTYRTGWMTWIWRIPLAQMEVWYIHILATRYAELLGFTQVVFPRIMPSLLLLGLSCRRRCRDR